MKILFPIPSPLSLKSFCTDPPQHTTLDLDTEAVLYKYWDVRNPREYHNHRYLPHTSLEELQRREIRLARLRSKNSRLTYEIATRVRRAGPKHYRGEAWYREV
jgi:hypothetical protein